MTTRYPSLDLPQATEQIHPCGIVKVRELPCDLSLEEYEQWWPRIALAERERYTVAEYKNVLTTAGLGRLLTFVSSSLPTTLGFAQYFAVGNGSIYNVSASDTALAGELFRAVPTSTQITGNQIEISTLLSGSQATGQITNAGFFGAGATSTPGSGTLHTHTLFTYNHVVNQPISVDYVYTLL